MRTTVNISDDLLTEAKVIAARQRRSLSAVVNDALRSALPVSGSTATPVILPTSGRCGVTPLVDIVDREALAEALGDNDAVPDGTARSAGC